MNVLKKYSVFKFANNIKNGFLKFSKERMSYRLTILSVNLSLDNKIVIDTLVSGVKNQIIQYTPEEIILNDLLLKEFSPCDVRAITYLSFRKYLNFDKNPSVLIKGQLIHSGKTIFVFLNTITMDVFEKNAIDAYQDYELLNAVNKTDMINIISTAVQEQTIKEFNTMG